MNIFCIFCTNNERKLPISQYISTCPVGKNTGLTMERHRVRINKAGRNVHEVIYVVDLKGKVLQCATTNGTKIAQTGKLKNSGLGELFDFVFISEDVGAEKPAKEFFDKVLADIEVKIGEFQLDEVLLVGDSLTSDIKGANNAGVKSCWYNPDGVPCDKDVQIDYEIKDLHEVYDLLK